MPESDNLIFFQTKMDKTLALQPCSTHIIHGIMRKTVQSNYHNLATTHSYVLAGST